MTLAIAGVLLVTAAVAVLFARRPRRRAIGGGILVLAVLVVAQLIQSGYVVTKYAEGAAGATDAAGRVWVDERVPGDQRVGMLAWGLGNSIVYEPIWRETAFWNRQPDLFLSPTPNYHVQLPRYGGGAEIRVDQRSGAIAAVDGRSLPRWWLMPTLSRQVGVAGTAIRQAPHVPLELVRLEGEPRATFVWEGGEPDGWLTDAAPRAIARIFPAARGASANPCLRFSLVAPGGSSEPQRYAVTAGDTRLRGVLRDGAQRNVRIPLRGDVRAVRVRTLDDSVRIPGGRRVRLQLGNTVVGSCDGP